jgi:prepilin-type N-terminal cleavage/methylation domain-containing protein
MFRKGFTLLEIIVAIAIIGLISAIIIPNFMRRAPSYERQEAVANLNALAQLAWQNALIEDKIHKLKFNLKTGRVFLEIATGEYGKEEPTFKPLERMHVSTEFIWPEHLEIRQFIVEKFDVMTLYVGKRSETVWFFIMPDGLAQDVIINFFDIKDQLPDGKARPIGLVLNPFNVQFKEYDTFQK